MSKSINQNKKYYNTYFYFLHAFRRAVFAFVVKVFNAKKSTRSRDVFGRRFGDISSRALIIRGSRGNNGFEKKLQKTHHSRGRPRELRRYNIRIAITFRE